MSRESDRAGAVARRCETICDVVGLVRSTGAPFVEQVFDAFPAEGNGPGAERGWSQRAYLLSQAFHGRFPVHGSDAVLRTVFAGGSIEAVHEALRGHPDAKAPQAQADLVPVAEGPPLLDVTYTAQVNFTSGIQRVVRSLAHHLPAVAPGAVLVRWDDRSRGFVPLGPGEVAAVQSPPPPAPADIPGGSLWGRIRHAASWPRRRLERTIRRHRRLAAERRLCQPTVLLWRQPLIIPELVGGTQHLEALQLVSHATSVRSTMVFYDALPIRHAELFPPHGRSVYLKSLSLVRSVDAISCISATVRGQLDQILAVMPERWPRPVVGVHHLGADFPAVGEPRAAAYTKPVVLCVGTIEPRKNQIRALRGMIEAQASGADFTGVFAGNAGWLDGPFRQEFAAAVAAGHGIVLREHVTDAELHALYRQAAFTLYCSLDEGLGLPIIESLRHGRPCISSDRGSMREIAERTGGCELVDPEDTAAIAAAIHRLVADADARGRLTRAAAAATWPSWRDYTETLVTFARTVPAAGRRAA